MATRARIVLDCADLGVAEAARRSSVSQTTATKWWRRYVEAGINGLDDAPRTGRPSAPDEVIRRVLRCTLDEPPNSAGRWTTRAVADAAGISQAAVSRIRRRHLSCLEQEARFLHALPTSTLVYIDIGQPGCALGFRPTANGLAGHRPPATPAQVDVVETVVCATYLRARSADDHDMTLIAATEGSGAVALLQRAVDRLPSTEGLTLVIDLELDAAAHRWLARHPDVTCHAVPVERWPGTVHCIAESIDRRQLPELREVQRLIRLARAQGAAEFGWSHEHEPVPSPSPEDVLQAQSATSAGDLAHVVQGLCTAVADGELQIGQTISTRRIARRSGASAGRVADVLAQLADDALISKEAGGFLLATPTHHDVIETYTARGLLGTAIARRLASARFALPPPIDEHYAGVIRCNELGLVSETDAFDLQLQDALAKAAGMPRIGSMFARLTLQLRLFVTTFGPSYCYPIDEIVADDERILLEIRRRDPDAAVEAWRNKIDNCVRYMLNHVEPSMIGATRRDKDALVRHLADPRARTYPATRIRTIAVRTR